MSAVKLSIDGDGRATNSIPSSPPIVAAEPSHEKATTSSTKPPIWRKLWMQVTAVLTYTPPRCRWDPAKPPEFTVALNLLFAAAATVTVANLYYNHPILNILAHEFQVPYEHVAQIPTVMQAGYAAGLLFLCPLGDLVKRRAFVVSLVLVTAVMWIGLCITTSLPVFTALSFLTAVTTVTPQLMLPLAGELAPPNRRATAIAIVSAGLMFGILIARLLSGVITNYVPWRAVYWTSFGLQLLLWSLLYLFMPDYPSSNPNGLSYFHILTSIIRIAFRSPLLIQASLISFFAAATITSFWTTVTFLLAGPPHYFPPQSIGLVALTILTSMLVSPIYARVVTDRFSAVPRLFSVVVGMLICLTGIVIGTFVGPVHPAGAIIQAALNDLGVQTGQIANRAAIYSIDPKARNWVNTAFLFATLCGQLMGTAAGNHIYASGGWVKSGCASIGFIGASLVFCALRGPWERGWIGWGGGWGVRRRGEDVEGGDKERQAEKVGETKLVGEQKQEAQDAERGITEVDPSGGLSQKGGQAGVDNR